MKFHIPVGSRLSAPADSLLQMLFTASLILLLIFGIRRQEAGDTFFNLLYTNLIFCSLFCSAIARPATILQTVAAYNFDPRYCTAYLFVLELETVGIPLAVLMLIVERVVYFSCLPLPAPLDTYKHRLSRAWKVLLVALPWFVGALVAFVKTFGLLCPLVPFSNGLQALDDTHRHYSCHIVDLGQETNNAGEGLLYSFTLGIPCVYLSVAIVVMVVYWNKAESFVNPTFEPEDQVHNKMQGKAAPALGNEGEVGLVWALRRNSYNVDSAKEDSKDESTLKIPDVADPLLENSPTQCSRNVVICDENATNQPTDAQMEERQIGVIGRRICSQDKETTKTHRPSPTSQKPNTKVEIHQIGDIQQRTSSQETTETHEPKQTSQHHLLSDEPHQPLLEPANKTNATVGIMILLALTCACVSVCGSVMVKFHGWVYESTQWLYFGIEFVAVLLAYCLPEVRQTLCCRKYTYGDQDRREQERKQKEMSNLLTFSYSTTEQGRVLCQPTV